MNLSLINLIGLVASIILPLWNIPLIVNVIKRKSSMDISLWWVFGVWTCLLLMLPSGIGSTDIVWKTFSISNLALFTLVVIIAVKYRKGPSR